MSTGTPGLGDLVRVATFLGLHGVTAPGESTSGCWPSPNVYPGVAATTERGGHVPVIRTALSGVPVRRTGS